MRISEVRIKLMEDPSDRLCAFCSITLDDCFVIRDLKIIQGAKGAFVAMPSRKLTDRCPKCHYKNHLRANFCNQCGVRLHAERASKDDDGRAKLYADISHPINSECRDQIQQLVISAYEEELVKSQQEGYVCSYDDFEEERYATLNEEHDEDNATPRSPQRPQSAHNSNRATSHLTLETEAGHMLRVDPAREKHEQAAHEPLPPDEHRPTASPSTEGFGEGII